MHTSILYFLFTTAALVAAENPLHLIRRQSTSPVSCSVQGLKDCGTGCIDLTDTCCPSREGGCSVGTYCSLGSNGEYGCCRNGRVCSGPGGVLVSSGVITLTSSRAVPVPAPFTTPRATPTVESSRQQLIPTPSASSVLNVIPNAISSALGSIQSTRPGLIPATTTSRGLMAGDPVATPSPGAANTGIQDVMLVGVLAFGALFVAI
jgi:hypothetical protein